MKLTVKLESLPYARPFVIARGAYTHCNVLVVELEDGELLGRGEAVPNRRFAQSPESERQALENLRPRIEAGLSREELRQLMPARAGRNALDCALWDLEAKKSGNSAWDLAGLTPPPGPLLIDITLSILEPEAMAAAAMERADFELLKVKLGKDTPMERIRAVRQARPDARLMVDANEAWEIDELKAYAPQLQELGVEFIEQPLKRGFDDALMDYDCPLPLAADESCHLPGDMEHLAALYDYINIKLDKTGGLTEALLVAKAAQAHGLGLMVGCNGGTSLAMAPAFIVASLCEYRDLDGPLLLKEDRQPAMPCVKGHLSPFSTALWG